MPIFLFIFFLLMVAYLILISYYHRGWEQAKVYEHSGKEPVTFVSIVISVRNEAHNIKELLASLYAQDYPASLFEVIFIDDHSTDTTWKLLQEAHHEYPSLMAIKLEAPAHINYSFKKLAIEAGIRAAKGQLIVTTDADCRFQTRWLSTIADFYETKNAKFIAAPVLMKDKGSLLTIFQTLDFLTLQGITAASVQRRFHSMCNGANLAYEREAFFEVRGFEGIDSIPTGDDMLLMHKIYLQHPDKVFYLKSPAAIVDTEPAMSWSAFFHQRIRWASKADQYKDKRIIAVLSMVYALNICFLVIAIASFWKNLWLFFFLALLLAKILVEFPFVQSVARFFGRQRLMWYFPFLQPLHILYTIIAGWLGRFGSYKWKGRRIER